MSPALFAVKTPFAVINEQPARSFASPSSGGKSKSKAKTAPSPTSSPTSTRHAAAPSSGSKAAAPATSNNGRGVDGDFVFGVQDLAKQLPGARVLFKDVNLMFQRGAKIGVLGLNGSGKSSLLKILASVDKCDVCWRCAV